MINIKLNIYSFMALRSHVQTQHIQVRVEPQQKQQNFEDR